MASAFASTSRALLRSAPASSTRRIASRLASVPGSAELCACTPARIGLRRISASASCRADAAQAAGQPKYAQSGQSASGAAQGRAQPPPVSSSPTSAGVAALRARRRALSGEDASAAAPAGAARVRLPTESPLSPSGTSAQSSSSAYAGRRPGYTAETIPAAQDPLLTTMIGILTKDGKRARAARQISAMMQHLQRATNAPSALPILRAAVDLAAPLVRMQSSKAGGGKIVQVPLALNERQRTRRAIAGIILASKKRGDKDISVRLAREIIGVVEGSSTVLQRKEEVHKIALANRSNASIRI